MTQQKNKAGRQQALKKYLVFAIMFIAFAACMWWIFAPSAADKEARRQSEGFNSDIPDPKGAGIVDDKKTAYEQEQARQRQEEKMRSLQEYSFLLGQEGEAPATAGETLQEDAALEGYHEPSGNTSGAGGHSNRRSNSFESSKSAYMDINHTLDNFYEEPEKDAEKEGLRQEVEQLKSAMAEQQKVATSYDDQVTLLEKSYELAAKYMPGGGTATGESEDTGNKKQGKKAEVVPVSHIEAPVVSSLVQPVSDLEFIRLFSRERNLEFHTAGVEETSESRNTIGAVVHGDQTLVSGQSVKLRVSEPMRVGRQMVPRNTILTGTGNISGERLEIVISSIEYEGNIIPVNMSVYDSDGQQGIYIPGSMEMTAVKEIVGNAGQNLNSSINISRQSAGEQLLTDLGRSAIQGTSQYISKKAREVKVTLKSGYRLFLLPGDSN
jgi:conjugative transposon TraM protein